LYYSNFISTATGDALDLIGEDLGVRRRCLKAQGKVTFTLTSPKPGEVYNFPVGTVVETDPPVKKFRTLTPFSLSEDEPEKDIDVIALKRGPDSGNINADEIKRINELFKKLYLDLGSAVVNVTNAESFTGGEITEKDDPEDEEGGYRSQLLGFPKNLWTLESVTRTVMIVEGVKDCALFDPLGGVDVSQSYFNLFNFGDRVFSAERRIGTPYFFDIVVAHHPGYIWKGEGIERGLYEEIMNTIEEVRPISIFPNIIRASHIEIGIRCSLIVAPGHDKDSIAANIKDQLFREINNYKLGDNVLHSAVLYMQMDQPGILDVQNLHLRRCPPRFGMINFSENIRFGKKGDFIEAAIGENIELNPREIAVFQLDSDLNEIEIIDR